MALRLLAPNKSGGLLKREKRSRFPRCCCERQFMILLLVQMAVVLLVTLACGWLARKVGQSRVIGEIVGGIVLGPSVFGRVAPQSAGVLFPASSFASFEILSTVGLILFLFLIGMELD